MPKKHIVVGLGELLWDMFPEGKQLGGAPANFAYITNLLGDVAIPASRVGVDAQGDEAIARLKSLGLETDAVQRDDEHTTGTVEVQVDRAGQPKFRIAENAAWDFLESSEEWQDLAASADAVCFGSLAQRSERSRETIRGFVRATREDALRIFDVNLRQHYYSAEIVAESMKLANVVKLNHEEVSTVMRLLGHEYASERGAAEKLLAEYELRLICVTRGSEGSLLLSPGDCSEHAGIKVKVMDTVGAGDAFTAAMAHGFLSGQSLEEINGRANRVGAWVAGERGAMPVAPSGGLGAL